MSRSWSTDSTSCGRERASSPCTARPQKKRPPKTHYRHRSHEYIRALHSATDRDRTADDRIARCRTCRVSVAAGGCAAERQLSNADGHRPDAWRGPTDDVLFGRFAARAPVRGNTRTPADDVSERARLHPGHAAIRFEPPD